MLLPSPISSLFLLAPHRDLKALRVGLAVVVAAMVGAVALRLPGIVMANVAVGIPLLFVLYLRQSVRVGRPAAPLVIAGALGAGSGVSFALWSGVVTSQAYGLPLESGIAVMHVLTVDAGISAAAAAMLLVPALITRLVRPGTRDPLHGFAIGALGAMCAAAAAVAVRMVAQLTSGLVDHTEPLADLLIEAMIRGVAVPVIAAAVGGIFGAALWFTRRPTSQDRLGRWVRPVLLVFVLGLMAAHACVGEEDIAGFAGPSQWAKLAWHLLFAVFAVLLLRLGLQLALLEQAWTSGDAQGAAVCTCCGQTVPGGAFCADCGVVMADEQCPATLSVRRMVLTWAAVIIALAASLVGVSVVKSKPTEHYLCPPNCGRKPMVRPLAASPRFSAADGAFEVSYPAPSSVYSVTTDDNGVTVHYLGGDGGVMRLFGVPAHGRNVKDLVTTLVHDKFPNSRVAYEIPNTLVGFRPGYGVALDDWPAGEDVKAPRTRILVMAAIKDDLALVAGAVGPYRELGSDAGPPTGVSLELAEDMGKYVNSFRWRGE